MATSDGGKGSSPKPFSVSNLEYATRWNEIFGKEVMVEYIDNTQYKPLTETMPEKSIPPNQTLLNE